MSDRKMGDSVELIAVSIRTALGDRGTGAWQDEVITALSGRIRTLVDEARKAGEESVYKTTGNMVKRS